MLFQLCKETTHGAFGPASGYGLGVLANLGFGAYVYGAGLPQKWSPGTFDLWAYSHILMHWTLMGAHICEFGFIYVMMLKQ
eukprot:8183011-Pyramimonas_sp.AAC.1